MKALLAYINNWDIERGSNWCFSTLTATANRIHAIMKTVV